MTKQLTPIFGFALALLLSISSHAAAIYTTYQAKIIKPDGTPLESTSVNFRFTILDPLGACILYTENFNTINMADTGGLVYFSLGSGIKTFPTSGSVSFSDVFNNYGAALSCAAGGPPSYSPVSNDLRKIVMQFHDGNGWQTLPAMSINHVPYAMYAKNAASATTAVNSTQLNGKTDLDFVQVTSIPTCSASQALQFNGASFGCVAVGSSGGGGTVVSVSGLAPIAISGSASAPVISISVASISSDGYLTAADYAEFKAVSATANNALVKSNNLSDLTNAATARTNLGLGSLATANSLDLGSASATGTISDTRLANQSGVTSGAQYTKVTVDGKGRVTSGALLSASDVTTALGYTPQASGVISSQWVDAGSAIYYSSGNVGIGTTNPLHSLDIEKSGTGSYTGAKTTITSTAGNATGFDTVVNGSNYSTGVLVDTQSALASVGIDVYASVTTSGGSWVRGVNVGIDDSLVAGTGLRLFAGSASTTPSKAIHISSGYNAGYAIYADTNGKSYFKGNVGIGTTIPATKLSVSGGLQISMESATCAVSYAGTLRYNAGAVEYCNGTTWSAFGGSVTSSSVISALGYTPANSATVVGRLTGVENLSFATGAGASLTVGSNYNILMGTNAGSSLTTGDENIVVGREAGKSNTTGFANLFIGSYAGTNNTGDENTFVGAYSGGASAGGSGSGYSNAIFGAYAGAYLTSGYQNTLIGYRSGQKITTGFRNYFGGYESGQDTTEGYRNVFIGYSAGLKNTTANNSVALGASALTWFISPAYTDAYNTAIGAEALTGVAAQSTGVRNTALGGKAGDSITTGSDNILIGYNADTPTPTTSNFINIGNTIYGNSSTGRVGIGTATPVGKLEVSGDASGTAGTIARFKGNSSWGSIDFYTMNTNQSFIGDFNVMNAFSWNTSTNTLLFYTNGGLERMRIDSSGNVGIGTTTPTAVLHLKAGASAVNTTPLKFTSGTLVTAPEAGAVEYDGNTLYYTNSVNGRRALATVSDVTAVSGTYVAKAGDTMTGTLNLPSNGLKVGTSQLTVSGAYVGIGTASPINLLHAHASAGNTVFKMSNASTGTTGSDGFVIQQTATDVNLINYEAGAMAFQTTATERMRITSAGAVGIGTTNPSATLHVSGSLLVTDRIKIQGTAGLPAPQMP